MNLAVSGWDGGSTRWWEAYTGTENIKMEQSPLRQGTECFPFLNSCIARSARDVYCIHSPQINNIGTHTDAWDLLFIKRLTENLNIPLILLLQQYGEKNYLKQCSAVILNLSQGRQPWSRCLILWPWVLCFSCVSAHLFVLVTPNQACFRSLDPGALLILKWGLGLPPFKTGPRD